ncbi:MAG: hypothetical protein ACLQBX_11240 [Candidatus Limnocylindrales bacterium]
MDRLSDRPTLTTDLPPGAPIGPFGPHSEEVRRFLERVSALSRREIVLLDLAERCDSELLLVGWDHVRFAATANEIAIDADDGYWRVQMGIGCGAARIVRAVAGVLVAPELLDPEYIDLALSPWRAAVREDPWVIDVGPRG